MAGFPHKALDGAAIMLRVPSLRLCRRAVEQGALFIVLADGAVAVGLGGEFELVREGSVELAIWIEDVLGAAARAHSDPRGLFLCRTARASDTYDGIVAAGDGRWTTFERVPEAARRASLLDTLAAVDGAPPPPAATLEELEALCHDARRAFAERVLDDVTRLDREIGATVALARSVASRVGHEIAAWTPFDEGLSKLEADRARRQRELLAYLDAEP